MPGRGVRGGNGVLAVMEDTGAEVGQLAVVGSGGIWTPRSFPGTTQRGDGVAPGTPAALDGSWHRCSELGFSWAVFSVLCLQSPAKMLFAAGPASAAVSGWAQHGSGMRVSWG